MQKRIIILSDLWGKPKSQWIECYKHTLKTRYEVCFYDCCKLAGLSLDAYTEQHIHHQFVNGGIDRAVQKLLKLEKKEVIILGFSVGGTIGWRFALLQQNVSSLYAVSSTRLRYETTKPENKIQLYYGGQDNFVPHQKWFDQMGIDCLIEKNKGHDLYKDKDFTKTICDTIKTYH